MDIQTWLFANSVVIALTIISGIIWVNTQNSERKGETNLVKQDLDNHKQSHKKLEDRVTLHESKLDDKLDELNTKIEDKHNILNAKLDGLKDLIIERISK